MTHGVLRWARWMAAAGLLLSGMSCAKAPGGGGTGLRLVVTMRYDGQIRDDYHYFFLIRNLGDIAGQNGPVPVTDPPYGVNGFAASKVPSRLDAFTDFVEYNRTNQHFVSSSGYTLYHVPGGTQANALTSGYSLSPSQQPVTAVQPNGGNVLQFELDLGQIAPGTGDTAPNPDLRPRYLQVNIISTTTVPENSAVIDNNFATDAMGDQRSAQGSDSFNTFITVDTSQIGKIYQSDLTPGPPEPTGDVYPRTDPSLDLAFWSIQVVQR